MATYWVRTRSAGFSAVVAWAINLVFGLIILVLAVRLVLRLFAANPHAPIVAWVYATSAQLLDWFRGMFPDIVFGNGFVLELTTLAAIIVYGLICNLLLWIVNAFSPD